MKAHQFGLGGWVRMAQKLEPGTQTKLQQI